jgi:serum/glucocorticoid-regulated kinase 2
MLLRERGVRPDQDYYFQTGKPLKCLRGQILQVEPIWRQPQRGRTQLSDFEVLRCIGTGGFSRVFLARHQSGKFYALKLMEKEGLLESGKECVVTNERDIMAELDSPQVLRLEYAFETKHFVALALECTAEHIQIAQVANCSTIYGE